MQEQWSKKTIIKLLALVLAVALCLFFIGFVLLQEKPLTFDENNHADVIRQYGSIAGSTFNMSPKPYSYMGNTIEQDVNVNEEEVLDEVVLETPREQLTFNLTDTAVTINDCYSDLSKQLNLALLEYCKNYFTLEGVTVFMPMIIANNETAIRADKDLTFCSLYPSKVLQPNSVADLEKMSTITVLESEYNFSNLANDWWTRDRGPLQMNPSYGLHSDIWKSQMGESEVEKLRSISNNFDYTVYTNKEGVISADKWISEACNFPGDRFSIKDCCLRLASEYNNAFKYMSPIYVCDKQEMKIAMLSMYHGAGSMWLTTYEDKKIGYWKSGRAAYRYAQALTSDDSLNYIYSYAQSVLASARSKNQNPDIGLTQTEAMSIYKTLKERGILEDKSAYISAGDYSDGYIVYPLKALYNYMLLSLLYNGG